MGDARAIEAPALGQGLAQHRTGQLGRGLFGRGVQRRQKERLHQPAPKGAAVLHHIADARPGAGPQQRRIVHIVAGMGTGHATRLAGDPIGYGALIGSQGPAFAIPQVHKGKFRPRRPGQRILRADAGQVIIHRAVARQHQVIAIVYHAVHGGIEIGAAAAAGLRRAFDQRDRHAARRQQGGGGQARQPPAHDICAAAHPKMPWRSTSDSSRDLGSEMRWRGGAKPAASLALRISE